MPRKAFNSSSARSSSCISALRGWGTQPRSRQDSSRRCWRLPKLGQAANQLNLQRTKRGSPVHLNALKCSVASLCELSDFPHPWLQKCSAGAVEDAESTSWEALPVVPMTVIRAGQGLEWMELS